MPVTQFSIDRVLVPDTTKTQVVAAVIGRERPSVGDSRPGAVGEPGAAA